MRPEQMKEEADRIQEKLVSMRRYLHTHPETGFDLKQTVTFVKSQLESMGYEPEMCGKAGVVVRIGGRKQGKVFLLRGDMDGLPVKEEAEVDFPAENGCMHACGHDMHTAMLLGAAELLKEHEEEIQGTIKLMFQPAEEIFQGSQDMLKAGVLKNPEVDAALMIHVMAGMPMPAGNVIVSNPGVSAPAADYFEIQVLGKGCHGSMPNMGVDPLTISAHILIGLQELHARELAMNEQAVLTIGTIHGGTAANIIPDSVVLGGSIRTMDEDTREYMKKRLTEIAEGSAKIFRGEAKVTFGSACPTLVNDKELSLCTEQYAKELLGQENVFSVAELSAMEQGKKSTKTAGSEDFSYVSQEVPSIMLTLAAGHPDQGYLYPQHHPKVMFDESVLSTGSAVYAYTAMRWLEEHKE